MHASPRNLGSKKGERIPDANNKAAYISKEIERSLKKEYNHIPTDQTEKILDGIQRLIDLGLQPGVSLHQFIHEAALVIYRTFPFKEISIGLKSQNDGRYRYEEVVGHTQTAAEALRKLSYSHEEFFSPKDYPAFWISEHTELALAEGRPFLESERDTYNRPILLLAVRKSLDDFIEGDYFDVYMYGLKDEMIGWIELGATKDGKMPSMLVIKQLEVLAFVLSCFVQRMMGTKNQ